MAQVPVLHLSWRPFPSARIRLQRFAIHPRETFEGAFLFCRTISSARKCAFIAWQKYEVFFLQNFLTFFRRKKQNVHSQEKSHSWEKKSQGLGKKSQGLGKKSHGMGKKSQGLIRKCLTCGNPQVRHRCKKWGIKGQTRCSMRSARSPGSMSMTGISTIV